MIIKACALALRKHPSLNAVFAGDAIVHPAEVAISVAVAIDEGLIAPDIHMADLKSVGAIAREVKEKAARAKAGKLSPDEYGQGTFTVSNLGMFGVDSFTAIINPGQAAILAVGAISPRAVVKDGAIAVAPMATMTLSVDHRIADGAMAASFLQCVRQMLETGAIAPTHAPA